MPCCGRLQPPPAPLDSDSLRWHEPRTHTQTKALALALHAPSDVRAHGHSPWSGALWLGLNDLCPVQQQPCPCRQRSSSLADRSLSAVAGTSHTGLRPYLASSVSYRPCQRGKNKPVSGKIEIKIQGASACLITQVRLAGRNPAS